MTQMLYSSIFLALNLIVFICGQQFEPQVHIGDANGTLVANGSTYDATAPANTNTNAFNITCGLDTDTIGISHVNLTCPSGTERPLNYSSLGPSGTFLLRIIGTGVVACHCSVTNTSGDIVGLTSFYLNLIVVPYVPGLAPIVLWNRNQTLADGDTLYIDLELRTNKTIILSYGVYDGYPLVSNITLTCNNKVVTFDKDNEAAYSFDITPAWNGARCVCSAGHVTGRYTLTSSFNVNVTPKIRVTWKGTILTEGYRLRVDLQGKKEISEVFTCSASSLVQKIEFSCKIPDKALPTSDSVYSSSATFTYTTNLVDKWITCKCTAYYSIIGTGKTETSSFLLSSQGDIKKGLMGMSMALLGSVLTTALVGQLLGHKSWF
ncbi:unnamed protein product [Lymnaea stagnalis]|uniref:Ig-like domain-containing protein n=1 Tax=Lymnaea stagnalis TaxID=6523 RepID=A0AAV2HTL5_LYMST